MNPRRLLSTAGERTRSVLSVLFWVVAFTAPLFGAEKANIGLSDGSVLKGARIVSVGENSVSILHEGGIISVASENVPLDVLARAHMELKPLTSSAEARAAEKAKILVPQELRADAPPREAVSQSTANDPAKSTPGVNQAGPTEKGARDAIEVKESSGLSRGGFDAGVDSPQTIFFLVGAVLCLALVILAWAYGFFAENIGQRVVVVVIVTTCMSLFCIYLWQRPQPSETSVARRIPDPVHDAAVAELIEIKRKGAAAYIGALDAKRGVSESTETMKEAGLSDAEIRAYRATNNP